MRDLAMLFEQQVACRPDATAVVFKQDSWSYCELNRSANQLAHLLMQYGIGPEDVVALAGTASPDVIVSMLAVVKVGAAYLPLDLTHPTERLTFILDEVEPAMVLTSTRHVHSPFSDLPVIALDHPDALYALARSDAKNPTEESRSRPFTPANSCYIMYTSGSTGVPKGVVVTQQGIIRLVCNPNYVALNAEQTFLQLAPIAFDASTFEIWGSLLNGGKLILFPGSLSALEDLGRVLRDEAINTLWLTAGLFHAVVNERLDDIAGVKQLLAGGDVLRIPEVKRVLERFPECRLVNGYGPTESTTFTCCHTVRLVDCEGSSIPIGKPISDTSVYVLDRRLRPVPVGVTGELYIAGAGLARGYL